MKWERRKNKMSNEQQSNYQNIKDREKFLKEYDFTKNAIEVPEEIDVEKFLKSLENVQNKENFIKHLQGKIDAQNRLTYLCLIEPTLKEPDIILTKESRVIKIKPFKKKNDDKIFEIAISEENDKILITSIPTSKEYFIKSKIRNADLIQVFTSQDSKGIEMPLGLPKNNTESISQETTNIQPKPKPKSKNNKFERNMQ